MTFPYFNVILSLITIFLVFLYLYSTFSLKNPPPGLFRWWWVVIILGLTVRLWNVIIKTLHTWDEKFHALVAKNLMDNPFQPILIKENLLHLNHEIWSFSHIWFSKPPLAHWPMAASMSIFGVNEIALRLPSLLFSIGSIWLC